MRDPVYLGGLAAVSQSLTVDANTRVNAISDALNSVRGVVYQANLSAFPRDVINAAQAQYQTLLAELNALSNELTYIGDQDYPAWATRADTLMSEVVQFDQTTVENLRQASPRRTVTIVASTVGALALVGLVGGLVWYSTRPGKSRRFRTRSRR